MRMLSRQPSRLNTSSAMKATSNGATGHRSQGQNTTSCVVISSRGDATKQDTKREYGASSMEVRNASEVCLSHRTHAVSRLIPLAQKKKKQKKNNTPPCMVRRRWRRPASASHQPWPWRQSPPAPPLGKDVHSTPLVQSIRFAPLIEASTEMQTPSSTVAREFAQTRCILVCILVRQT